jgi:hypothetical protein
VRSLAALVPETQRPARDDHMTSQPPQTQQPDQTPNPGGNVPSGAERPQ